MFPQTSSSSHRRENGMTGPPFPPKDASLASRRRGRQAPGVRLSPGFVPPKVLAESRPNATGRQRLPSGPRGMVASRPPPPPPKGSTLPREDQQALSAGLNESHPRMSAQRKKPTNRFDLLPALPGMWPGEQGVLPPSMFQKAVPPTYSWVEHRNGRYLVPGESGEFSHPTAPDQRRVANGLSTSRQEHRSEGRREEPVYSDAWRYYLTNPTPATSKSKQGEPPAGSRPRVPERPKTPYIGDYRLAEDRTRTRKPSGERRIDATPEGSNGTLSSRNSPQSPFGYGEHYTPPTSLDISPPNKRSLPTAPLFTASPESYSPCEQFSSVRRGDKGECGDQRDVTNGLGGTERTRHCHIAHQGYLAPVAKTRTQTARLVRNELATEISIELISTSHEHNVNDEPEPIAVTPVAREISTPPLPPTALFIEPPTLQLDQAAAERMAIASTTGRSSSPTYTAVSLSTTVIPLSHPSLTTRELWSIRERVKQLETVQYQLSLSLGRSKPPKNALELGWTKETLEQVRRIRSDEKQEFKKVTRDLEELIEVLCIAQTTGR